MNSVKCNFCGLSHFASEENCKRCGRLLNIAPSKAVAGNKPKGTLYPILFVALAAAVGYYFYNGISDNVSQIDANEAYRIETQKKDPTAGLSRSEQQKHKTQTYANAVSNAPALQTQKKHDEDVKRAMQEASR